MWLAFGVGSSYWVLSHSPNGHKYAPRTASFSSSFPCIHWLWQFLLLLEETRWRLTLRRHGYPFQRQRHLQSSRMQWPRSEASLCNWLRGSDFLYIYDRINDIVRVNVARSHLFTHKSRSLDNILRSDSACAAHPASLLPRNSVEPSTGVILSDAGSIQLELGWEIDNDGWQPLRTSLVEASKSCHELFWCSCKTKYVGLCECTLAELAWNCASANEDAMESGRVSRLGHHIRM